MSLSSWQRWGRAPQTLAWRRVLMKIHLWMGLTFGIYLFLICVSGSAVVLRPQFAQWFIPSQVAEVAGTPLQGEALEAAVQSAYPGRVVTFISPHPNPQRATYLGLETGGDLAETRFFDQYSGRDLGVSHPWPVATMEWLVDFHDNLLSGTTGRKVNGIGGALFIVMVISGLVLWWPGRTGWKYSLLPLRGGRQSLLWQLHSVFGLWAAFLMLVWGITAVYFALPGTFENFIDWLDDDLNDFERPDGFLLWLVKMHFGRFGGMWGRSLWILLGLLPAFMFASGFWLWWKKGLNRSQQ